MTRSATPFCNNFVRPPQISATAATRVAAMPGRELGRELRLHVGRDRNGKSALMSGQHMPAPGSSRNLPGSTVTIRTPLSPCTRSGATRSQLDVLFTVARCGAGGPYGHSAAPDDCPAAHLGNISEDGLADIPVST